MARPTCLSMSQHNINQYTTVQYNTLQSSNVLLYCTVLVNTVYLEYSTVRGIESTGKMYLWRTAGEWIKRQNAYGLVCYVYVLQYYATHTSTPHEQVHPSLIAYFARLFTHRPAPFTHTHTLTCAHCPSSHSTADVSQSRDYSSDSLPTSMIRLT